MIRYSLSLLLVLGLMIFVSSCEQDDISATDAVPNEVIDQLRHMGFNPDGIRKMDDGYLIENDILITEEFLRSEITEHRVPQAEQYSTNNLVSVSGSRVITVYMDAPDASGNSTVAGTTGNGNSGNARGGKPGGGGGGGGGGTQFDQNYANALQIAIDRYNAENLTITFQRVSSPNGADITFTRLKKGDERQGILGSAGFPTSSGNPHNQILMSGIIASTYNYSTEAIATVFAHEMGHCIGFRHTDYFDRSISCGGNPVNEGPSTIGANHIPGTPTGATRAAGSFMLSCSGGGDRPFNNDDKTALDFLY